MRRFLYSTVALLALSEHATAAWAQQQGGQYYGSHHMWDSGPCVFAVPLMMIVFVAVTALIVVLLVTLARRAAP